MRLIHDAAVAERFPGHATGAVRVRAEAALVPGEDGVERLRQRIRDDGAAAARAAAERWREVFAAMGAKPKHRSSIDALVGLLDEVGVEQIGGRLPPLVRFYNLLSLALGVPMAGYRTERIAGDLRLTVPGKGQPFTPLGRPREQERTRGGEVAYLDDEKVVCRYWNLVDSDVTKLGDEQSDVLFLFDLVVDLLPSGPDGLLADAQREILAALPGAEASSGLADGVEAPSASL
jgi:DNA/RNA-binding domain of Phe-tRNA-synthetase-like protein